MLREREESLKTCICGKQRGTHPNKGESMDKQQKKRGEEIWGGSKTGRPRGNKERADGPESGNSKSTINRARRKGYQRTKRPISYSQCGGIGEQGDIINCRPSGQQVIWVWKGVEARLRCLQPPTPLTPRQEFPRSSDAPYPSLGYGNR